MCLRLASRTPCGTLVLPSRPEVAPPCCAQMVRLIWPGRLTLQLAQPLAIQTAEPGPACTMRKCVAKALPCLDAQKAAIDIPAEQARCPNH